MKNKVFNMTYASSITNLCEVNSSFDTGILRIAYTGNNRNGSHISKKAFEKCLETIYNCPIVCNYDRDSDTLGGHDMDIVRGADGALRLINITTPVGCIPESAKTFWETVEEEDGTTHEYLCAEALIWKRQEAYSKIKRDGITAQSMEITVKDGETIDGVFQIYDFEFTAFALIGVEPCYESASLEFSKQDFKQQLSQMMLEIKESFSKVDTSKEVNDIQTDYFSMEGGEKVLNEKIELVAKYGVEMDKLDFSIEDFTLEELEAKFKAVTDEQNDNSADDDNHDVQTGLDNKFELESNMIDELIRVLESEKVQREWGECTRYWFVDYDRDINEVYCWDSTDWLLFGFEYEANSDSIAVKQETKKRKKFAIVDFDEGEQSSPFTQVFEMMEQKIQSNTEWEAKYQSASDTIATMEAELGELRKFKADTEEGIANSAREKVFKQFEDLTGIEAFEKLRESCSEYDAETLEEKCFAIRGRNAALKFSHEPKTPKLMVDKTEIPQNEPYGGVFRKYGVEKEN